MHKKLTVINICIICLVLTSVKVFAGDIPESPTVNTQAAISAKNIVFLILTILVLFSIIVMYVFVLKKLR